MAKAPAKKTRLGRGLSSLLNVEADAGQPQATPKPATPAAPPVKPVAAEPVRGEIIRELPVDDVRPNPRQPRREFDERELGELSASIRVNGLIQPIVVRPAGEGFELIAGERRLRASKLAGLDTIAAIVRDADAMTQAQLALVENIQRADLNPIERAESYQALLDELGLTQAELATRLGEDRSSIANHVRLLSLAGSAREAVRDGKLTLGHAKVLAGVDDPAEQDRLAKLAVSQELSVRNLERLMKEKPAAPAPKAARDAHLERVSEQMARQLGTRVEVHGRPGGKGRIVIHYGNLDAFDDLLGRMDVRLDD